MGILISFRFGQTNQGRTVPPALFVIKMDVVVLDIGKLVRRRLTWPDPSELVRESTVSEKLWRESNDANCACVIEPSSRARSKRPIIAPISTRVFRRTVHQGFTQRALCNRSNS
jgi:hypothetical protein